MLFAITVMVTGLPGSREISMSGVYSGVLRSVGERGGKQCQTGEVKLQQSLNRNSGNISGSWEDGMAL